MLYFRPLLNWNWSCRLATSSLCMCVAKMRIDMQNTNMVNRLKQMLSKDGGGLAKSARRSVLWSVHLECACAPRCWILIYSSDSLVLRPEPVHAVKKMDKSREKKLAKWNGAWWSQSACATCQKPWLHAAANAKWKTLKVKENNNNAAAAAAARAASATTFILKTQLSLHGTFSFSSTLSLAPVVFTSASIRAVARKLACLISQPK